MVSLMKGFLFCFVLLCLVIEVVVVVVFVPYALRFRDLGLPSVCGSIF